MTEIKGMLQRNTGFREVESKFDKLIDYFEQKKY